MKNAESGRVTLRDVEFEELLRTAFESRQPSSMNERKAPKNRRQDGDKQHSISSM